MATRTPISTISYNTEKFLVEKLNEWKKAHWIQSYMYICHKGEDGDKDHIHLRIEPNKSLDPMDLTDELKEYDPTNNKPLCVRPWRTSKEEDWILYAVHDKTYLDWKYDGGEKGEKLPYSKDDIRADDGFDIEVAFIRAKAYLEHTAPNLAKRMQEGEDTYKMILQGENPYLINGLKRALADEPYQKLKAEYDRLYDLKERLLKAIEEANLVVVEEDGKTVIKPFEE